MQLVNALAVLFTLAAPLHAGAQELSLAVPAEISESGFLGHLLPRFTLKHRIRVAPVSGAAEAQMALVAGGEAGEPVFRSGEGVVYRLALREDSARTRKFRDWLLSAPGIAAIEGFPPGGPPRFLAPLPEAAASGEIILTGDAIAGAGLALRHCGRCHVVDERNPMGGIGSTPSFGAIRARGNWHELFTKFWTEPPHPSFTQVAGVTDDFTPQNPPHSAPVVDGDEVAAIIAFIATLAPKDLGPPLSY